MRKAVPIVALLAVTLMVTLAGSPPRFGSAEPGEWQVTSSPISHLLDNNDNFSKDNKYLCYDTRDTLGTGIGNGTTVMKVDITTGVESTIYAPQPFIISATAPAPGLGAVSFSPVADEVVFIHGPLVADVPTRGPYGKTNRSGALVPADGSGKVTWIDARDVTSEVTPPGAHRGGSHRHEWTAEGNRVGFTYDDQLLPQYGRTIGMMVKHAQAPAGATHWATLLVVPVPAGTAKTGELEQADNDSWVGSRGQMRGFIGKVREADGSYMSSLYVVDVPETVDITTSDSGTKTRMMAPPQGVTVRRLTHKAAGGIVRGSLDGSRIAYYATGADGSWQIFVIPSKGSDTDPDPAMRPVQATFHEKGASGGLRWHPSGNSIAVLSDNGVVVTCVKPGPLFGVSYFVTPHGAQYPAPEALVFSRDGRRLAFNRRVPTADANGKYIKDAGNNDFRQIFLTNFPDANNNGIADPIEDGVVRNTASYQMGKAAPESWASLFGTDLAAETVVAAAPPLPTSLGGVTVEVADVGGVKRPALLHFVSREQINFILPAGTRPGAATVTVTSAGRGKVTVPVQVDACSPGLFTANANGSGVAAAVALRIDAQGTQTPVPVFQCAGGACASTPIDLGPASDQMILLLYGTGIRWYGSSVTAKIGGQTADVLGAAAHGDYVGLDQINVRIPRALAGKGEVPIEVTVDGKKANTVLVNIR